MAPPRWYVRLVRCCLVGGGLLAVSAFLPWLSWLWLDSVWRLWIGLAVVLAGVWAALSNERLSVDLRAGTLVRWEGTGWLESRTKGRVVDLDALVLLAECTLGPYGPVVVYRLVLHWKQSRLPLLVVEQESVPQTSGGPINSGAGMLLARGAHLARVLGFPFHDNSHFHSPSPVQPI